MDGTKFLVLWERPPIVCFFTTRAVEPRYEIRLHIDGVLFDSRCFSTTEESSAYAIAQMRAYRPETRIGSI